MDEPIQRPIGPLKTHSMKYPILELYRDRKNEFRARLKAPNGKIIFETSEAYKRKAGLMNAIKYLGIDYQLKILKSFGLKRRKLSLK